MKWQKGPHYNDLTIIVVAHNLIELHYPFIESFISAIPLGCRFLYGNCSSTDNSLEFIDRLKGYAHVDIINLPWQVEKGGQAIGEATQDLMDATVTPFVYNLQACEVLCEDVPQIVNNTELCAMWCHFHHFWGSFNFDGSVDCRAYREAPRLFNKKYVNLRESDGCWDTATWAGPMEHSGWKRAGTICRYSYLWDNQAVAKAKNHYQLYGRDVQTPEQRLHSINWCKNNTNYSGDHPQVISHLLDRINYDIDYSWQRLVDVLELAFPLES